jgi:hypothetical protein
MTLTDAQSLLILFVVLYAVWAEYFEPRMYFTGTSTPSDEPEQYEIVSITSESVTRIKR